MLARRPESSRFSGSDLGISALIAVRQKLPFLVLAEIKGEEFAGLSEVKDSLVAAKIWSCILTRISALLFFWLFL